MKNIVFIGTPQFAAIILEKLIQSEYKPSLVITAPDKPTGRKQILTEPIVKTIAKKHNLTILQPNKIQDIKDKIKEHNPILIIVASYGQIIPKGILDLAKEGSLNVHPSMLPKYRGASPIQNTILNGDQNTGVTIMLMDEKMDHGPILSQEVLSNITNLTFTELHDKLANIGANLLISTISKYLNKEIKPKTQEEDKVTYTKLLKKEDGRIDWNKPATNIERKVRALNPWPGTYTFFYENDKTKKVKILKTKVIPSPFKETFPIGKILNIDNKIAIQTTQDLLLIEELQPEGKKAMSSEDFLRGNINYVTVQ